MKRLITIAGFMLSMLVAGSGAFAQNLGWPRTIEQPAGKLVLFQPHVDSWDSEIVWRQAFQLTPAGGAMTRRRGLLPGHEQHEHGNADHHDLGDPGDQHLLPRSRCVRIAPAGCAAALADASDAGSVSPAPRRLHAYARQHEAATQPGVPAGHPRELFARSAAAGEGAAGPDARAEDTPEVRGQHLVAAVPGLGRMAISTCCPTTSGSRPASSKVPGRALPACRRTFAACPPTTALRRCAALCRLHPCATRSCLRCSTPRPRPT